MHIFKSNDGLRRNTLSIAMYWSLQTRIDQHCALTRLAVHCVQKLSFHFWTDGNFSLTLFGSAHSWTWVKSLLTGPWHPSKECFHHIEQLLWLYFVDNGCSVFFHNSKVLALPSSSPVPTKISYVLPHPYVKWKCAKSCWDDDDITCFALYMLIAPKSAL